MHSFWSFADPLELISVLHACMLVLATGSSVTFSEACKSDMSKYCSGMIFGFKGYMPHALKPDKALAGVAARIHALPISFPD